MKLVVFSDIHGNLPALDAFLEKIETLSYDALVFCGDIFGYYYHQKEIIERLYHGMSDEKQYIQKYGHSYANVRKRFHEEEARLIDRHKPEHQMECNGCRIGIFHGTPENSLEGRLYPDRFVSNPDDYRNYDLVILGHTHCRMLRKEQNTLIVNSGSLGQPRDGNGFGYAVVDTESLQAEFGEVTIDRKRLYREIDRYEN